MERDCPGTLKLFGEELSGYTKTDRRGIISSVPTTETFTRNVRVNGLAVFTSRRQQTAFVFQTHGVVPGKTDFQLTSQASYFHGNFTLVVSNKCNELQCR